MSRRTERVCDLLRAELSRLLLEEVRDPRVRLTTVSNVEVSPDLRYARIRVSVLGSDAERLGAVEALQNGRGFLRHQLASRLRLRYAPELAFDLDRGAEHAEMITRLLEESSDDHPTS
jgi:ribosome-binding factor A